jgi:hypothetical protein
VIAIVIWNLDDAGLFTYSLAQRYGSNARMFARAQVCRLKGDCFGAIFVDDYCSMAVEVNRWRGRKIYFEAGLGNFLTCKALGPPLMAVIQSILCSLCNLPRPLFSSSCDVSWRYMGVMEFKYCTALHILTDFKLGVPPYHYIVPELVRVRIKFSFQLFVAW